MAFRSNIYAIQNKYLPEDGLSGCTCRKIAVRRDSEINTDIRFQSLNHPELYETQVLKVRIFGTSHFRVMKD
jgi:hypothetical protein